MAREAKLTLETVEGDGLRFRAQVDASPVFVLDSGPAMQGPDPMQAILAAVAGCTAMDVISILRKQRQVVLGYEVEAHGERRETYPRAFTKIEVVHRLRGRGLDEKKVAEAIRLSEEKYCSAHATLRPTVELTSRFEIANES
jgi:putative redox protein